MIKEVHKHIVITDDNDEYPIFDDMISVDKMNEIVEQSKQIVNEIKQKYSELDEH